MQSRPRRRCARALLAAGIVACAGCTHTYQLSPHQAPDRIEALNRRTSSSRTAVWTADSLRLDFDGVEVRRDSVIGTRPDVRTALHLDDVQAISITSAGRGAFDAAAMGAAAGVAVGFLAPTEHCSGFALAQTCETSSRSELVFSGLASGVVIGAVVGLLVRSTLRYEVTGSGGSVPSRLRAHVSPGPRGGVALGGRVRIR